MFLSHIFGGVNGMTPVPQFKIPGAIFNLEFQLFSLRIWIINILSLCFMTFCTLFSCENICICQTDVILLWCKKLVFKKTLKYRQNINKIPHIWMTGFGVALIFHSAQCMMVYICWVSYYWFCTTFHCALCNTLTYFGQHNKLAISLCSPLFSEWWVTSDSLRVCD